MGYRRVPQSAAARPPLLLLLLLLLHLSGGSARKVGGKAAAAATALAAALDQLRSANLPRALDPLLLLLHLGCLGGSGSGGN